MRARFTVAIALAIGVFLAGAGAAAAQDGRGNDTSAELREAVTVPGIKEHLLALQRIGQGFRGNRLAGTPGLRRARRTTWPCVPCARGSR